MISGRQANVVAPRGLFSSLKCNIAVPLTAEAKTDATQLFTNNKRTFVLLGFAYLEQLFIIHNHTGYYNKE